jgi:hypothetical protein
MPPALQRVLERPWVGDIELSAGAPASFGAVAARQPRFRFAEDPAEPGGVRLTPETGAAERLMRDPTSAQLLDALRGVRLLEPDATLTGIALSTSNNGAAANTLLADLESQVAVVPGGSSDRAVESLQEHADDASWARSRGMGAEYDLASGWMLLGPEFTRSLLLAVDPDASNSVREAAAAESGTVLAHEAAHAVTPPSKSAFARVPWLEEATADLMVSLPGSGERIAAATGLERAPGHESDGRYYDAERATLGSVLKLAGLDAAESADVPRIRELLQSHQLGHVPRRIAEAIAQRHDLAPTRIADLTTLVEQAHHDHAASLQAAVAADIPR